ncbi:late transcription factor VLTF-1 [Nile crocodilepox virus]|uniref:Late transcription factor 1 n=1 Tax=Nile crocodilepox virus (isolate Crocodylus niloticus/Zimbabwe/Ume/2001) TaxID=1289473 RepID=Q070H1_CPRVZ|nr:late transcription factor VLTF-1 [Nile crocodilepox virus]ABJ08971.1 late transcription factor VLTF-1 [Nile crocodilepox virus]
MSLRIKLGKLKEIVSFFSEFSEEISLNVDRANSTLYIFSSLGAVNIWSIVPIQSNIFCDGDVGFVFNVPVIKVKNCLSSFHHDSLVTLSAGDGCVTLSGEHVVAVTIRDRNREHRTDTSISLSVGQDKFYIFNFLKYEEKCCARTIVSLDLLLGFIKSINNYQFLTVAVDGDCNLILRTPGSKDVFVMRYSTTECSDELQNYTFRVPICSLTKLKGFKKKISVFEMRVVMDVDSNILGMLFRERLGKDLINVFIPFCD